MSDYQNNAAEEKRRRQEELRRRTERRIEGLARELSSKRIEGQSIEKLERPVSEAEYYRDCGHDLAREMAEAERKRH